MLSHYHADINPDDDNNSHVVMLRMIGFNKRVLEAGCASGHVSEMLHAQGCSVVGVEIDSTVVQPAMQWLERVIIGNFDDNKLWIDLEGEFFDAILFGDVLEHLKDPLIALRESAKHLRPSGMVVISVPNIAHADVKLALIKGTFPYGDTGLLDRTHIYFFTKEGLLDLVKEAGLVTTEICRVTIPVFSTEIGVQRSDVNDEVLEAILKDRESETYQFVIKAVRDDGARSLQGLSTQLVELTDQLHDETRRFEALRTTYEDLTIELQTLETLHKADQLDLARLRHQTDLVKRFIPGPVLNFFRRRINEQ
ncbi:MAG TPA: class I SAM-dependent methyltransferase [Acidimicrobiales bacterium]|nr:class I SAM-dependent methyltransferase [Acidimicrobiales bacterium]